MKSEKATMPVSGEEKGSQTKFTGAKAFKSKSGAVDSDVPSPVEQTKPSSGRGLANEGTTVSYDEER